MMSALIGVPIFVLVFLAVFGKSLGIRRLYVKGLLMVFEVVSNITTAHAKERHKRATFSLSSDSEDEVDDDHIEALENFPSSHINGGVKGNTVISRKDNLILDPSGSSKNDTNQISKPSSTENLSDKILSRKCVSAATFQREFLLSDVLDYVKTGIASIIEDEVTKRFVAEELKTWNLLTRTSQSFEFINVRLTVIWILGFFVRYFILLPGRMCIFLIGSVFLLAMMILIPLLPFMRLRRAVYDIASLASFRLFARSISASIKFHNTEYRPKLGICVANHTTPIDVVILSNDRSYAMLTNMCFWMVIIGAFPNCLLKKWLYYHVFTICFQLLGGAISAVITYHNSENKPCQGICVANHTSPLDVLVLACDNAYALIGQKHGGFMGIIQAILEKASHHIWFERGEAKDRLFVVKRLKEHVDDINKLPILIFPEGTCINNTSVMQFKKGCFEVGGVIYPVAIKYDARFGDAFWNSSSSGMLHYVFMMMTSWAIVCDVWYLPPMTMRPDEDAIAFANRVKGEIAGKGGLVDLVWDGNLKRNQVKSEWKAKQQEEFSKRIKVE